MISTVASGDVGRYVGACRHHDDALGRRRAGPELRSLAPGARQRRRTRWSAWSRRAGPPRRDARGTRPAAASGPPAVGLTMFGVTTPCVRQVAAALARRLRLPGLPRHRHRRPVDGEARRVGQAPGRHRPHHDRGLRPAVRRRLPRDRGPLRRDDPRAHALRRLLRRARHGQFRRRPRRCRSDTAAAASTSTTRRSR